MATRVGIEFSPVACRLIELEGPGVLPGRPPVTRVRSFSVLPPSGPETDRALSSLSRRPVAVVLWGVRSHHRQVTVSNGSYEKMRAEALALTRAAGVDTRGTLADITTASTAIKRANRQPVVLALANGTDVSAMIRPLIDAGIRIRTVITPADALLGLARARQAFAVPGGIEAYVALDATATCVALVRDGSLLSARELTWGYEEGPAAVLQDADAFPRRDDLAARLIDELANFLAALGADSTAVTQVAICGGLPDLRTMTVPLMERLDIEVETLDSLFGIDLEHLPQPADEFRERASELRIAWAAAADWRGPINLLRHRRRRDRRVVVARVAVAGGVVAGLAGGWAIERSTWWQSTAPALIARKTASPIEAPPSAPARSNAAPRPQPPVTAPKPPAATPPAAAAPPQPTPPAPQKPLPIAPPAPVIPPAIAPPAAQPVAPPPTAVPIKPPPTPPRPLPIAPSPGVTAPVTPPVVNVPPKPAAVVPAKPATTVPTGPAPAAPAKPAVSAPSRSAAVAPARPTSTAQAERSSRPPARAETAAPAPTPRAQPAAPAAPPAAPIVPPRPRPSPADASEGVSPRQTVRRSTEPPPLPFEALLGTILYSPDRKLAIINGRIVGVGDQVNGATITDITITTVLLRDARGRLRSLTLGAPGRSSAAP